MKAILYFRSASVMLGILAPVLLSGCESEKLPYGRPEDIVFKDKVATNAKVPDKVSELEFIDTAGQKVHIGDFQGKKNVLLVITRGYTDPLCVFCQAQTSRLVTNYPKFKESNTEVLLVYPGQKGQLEQFLKKVDPVDDGQIDQVPFRILLDDGLAAVNFFGIKKNRAQPSTYLFDKQGQIRFAYVGKSDSDRPSIKAMLEQISLLGQ